MRFHGARRFGSISGQRGSSRQSGDRLAANVATISEIEQREVQRMGLSDHVADRVSRLSGSMLYVWLHVAWFTGWVLLNAGLVGGTLAFDPFPFSFLTMVVSLEAIFLSTFVLISQNRQAALADRRAHVDLQVNLAAEQEVTKLLRLVRDIHEHLGIEAEDDGELAEMAAETDVSSIAKAVEAG